MGVNNENICQSLNYCWLRIEKKICNLTECNSIAFTANTILLLSLENRKAPKHQVSHKNQFPFMECDAALIVAKQIADPFANDFMEILQPRFGLCLSFASLPWRHDNLLVAMEMLLWRCITCITWFHWALPWYTMLFLCSVSCVGLLSPIFAVWFTSSPVYIPKSLPLMPWMLAPKC